MKVLLTHRFFWPDTAPYASILQTIASALAMDGHQVQVLSTTPSYRQDVSHKLVPKHEDLVDFSITRIWVLANEKANALRRILNVLMYCSAIFITVLRVRPDVVMAATTPPVVAAWTASFAAKLIRSKFVYHVQDIHPEVSLYSNGWLGRGGALRLLRFLDNRTLRRSAAIVVLSQDMKETLEARGLSDLPISVINNFSLDAFDTWQEPPMALKKAPGVIRVIFAGNLGRFQNLPRLAEGVSLLFAKYPQLELMFLGDGAALPELRKAWSHSPQVTFGPFLPFPQARVLIENADIGLVALSPDIYRVAYPSKVTTYLSLGLPLLVFLEPHSALSQDLVQAGVAEVPASESPEDIADALERLLEDPHVVSVSDWDTHSTLRADWQALFQDLEGLAT